MYITGDHLHIDVCIPVFRNYELIKLQAEHFQRIDRRFRIIACDNTPIKEKQPCKIDGVRWFSRDVDPQKVTDIISQGEAYELMKHHTDSDVICLMESDFFWLNPNLYQDVVEAMDTYDCIGTSPKAMKTIEQGGYFSDWVAKLCQMFPHKATVPFYWGMFVKRDIAMKQSLEQKDERFETAHLLRDELINRPCLVLDGRQYENCDQDTYYFCKDDKPWGVHLFAGSHRFRINELQMFMNKTQGYINYGLNQWRK